MIPISPRKAPRLVSQMDVVLFRSLPRDTQLLVAEGQRVLPDTILGVSHGPETFLELTNAGTEDVRQFFFREIGDTVVRGEVVGQRELLGGMIQELYRTPLSGEIAGLTARGMTLRRSDIQIPSLVHGRVCAAGKGGVEIATCCSLLECEWGHGPDVRGPLYWHDSLTAILSGDEPVMGRILAVSDSPSFEALRHAHQGGAAGLIAPSCSFSVLSKFFAYLADMALTPQKGPAAAADHSQSLVLVGGVGPGQYSDRVRGRLKSLHGAHVGLSPASERPYLVLDSEACVAGSQETPQTAPDGFVSPGDRVRVALGPYRGLFGQVMEEDRPDRLPDSPWDWESRALVDLGEQQRWIPSTWLERA